MSPNESERKLLQGVLMRDFEAAKAALAVGANVSGSSEEPVPALAAAAMANRFRHDLLLFDSEMWLIPTDLF